MKCPHCRISFHEVWNTHQLSWQSNFTGWQAALCKCPECKSFVVMIADNSNDFRMVEPLGSKRAAVPVEVPPAIAADYVEASNVLAISAKAAAALARRCLQGILRENGYAAKDLAKEIDLLLHEQDPLKAIPQSLRTTIDGVRNFGNFSAHPINDTTSLQVISVEPHEAEWCLDIIDEMFEHFYVRPAQAKARKAALDAKLAAAGKPASK